MLRQITGTSKNYQGDITEVHGADFTYTVAQAVAFIEGGVYSFYTLVNGRRANVTVARTAAGRKFLRTDADSTYVNNLDNLPVLRRTA